MAAPEGYTELGVVGYTDKGTYAAGTTYNRYNVVLYGGSSYVALKDGLKGIAPSNDGSNWRLFANGFPTNGVTSDNFQDNLENYLANNGTTTNAGYALDARFGKTLADQVSELNASVQKGSVEITPNEENLFHVKFSQKFEISPLVFLNIRTSFPSKRIVTATNITSEGFDICLYNESDPSDTKVDWIAFAN